MSSRNDRNPYYSSRINNNRRRWVNPNSKRGVAERVSRRERNRRDTGYFANKDMPARHHRFHDVPDRFENYRCHNSPLLSNISGNNEATTSMQENQPKYFPDNSPNIHSTPISASTERRGCNIPSADISSRGENEVLLEQEQISKCQTVTELLKEVSSEPDANESNIASKFFQALVTHLLSLTDILPEQRSYIYNILSVLVDVGMRCAHKELPTLETVSEPQVAANGPEVPSNHLKDLRLLIDVDFRFQTLLNQRIDLYRNIYDIFLRQQPEPSSNAENRSLYFDKNVVQKAMTHIKAEILKTSASLNNFKSQVTLSDLSQRNCDTEASAGLLPEASNEKTDNLLDSSESGSALSHPCLNIGTDNSENSSNGHVFSQSQPSFGSISSTELLCFSICDQAIIAGYKNGSLLIFSLDSGILLDNVQPHRKAITSITVWENTVITTSLDGSMRIYDLKNHTIKKVIVGQEIFTSCQFNGILYLGTISGFVFRLLLKDMKQISNPFCVSQKTVLAIKVTEDNSKQLMFIASLGRDICIRDSKTGTLIQILKNSESASSLIILKGTSTLRICAGCKDELVICGLENSPSSLIKIKLTVTCVLLGRGVIFAASNDNQIYMYEEKTIKSLGVLTKINGLVKAMALWCNFLLLATSNEGFKYVKIPKMFSNV